MDQNYIDLKNLAIMYHIDIFRLVNTAMIKGIPIYDFSVKKTDLEQLALIELIPMNDKVAIHKYKYDEVQRDLVRLQPDIEKKQQELKIYPGKTQTQTMEELEKLLIHKANLEKEASTHSQYLNGRTK